MKEILRAADFTMVGPGSIELTPRAVRDIVLREHRHLRELLSRAFDAARRVSAGSAGADDVQTMVGTARDAYTALVAHTELEDQLLAPVLESIDAWGGVRARELRREHVLQRRGLLRALEQLELPSPSLAALAASIEDLLHEVHLDMEREEAELLRSDLLLDEMITVNTSGG